MTRPFRTRFAPSPTGLLHLGHVYAAQQAFNAARDVGGECLLRIEDIDHTRCKPAFTGALYEDLAWLGFDWPEPVRVQSHHRDDYATVIDILNARGLVYRCFKTRRELPSGRYLGGPLSETEEHENLAQGLPYAWRLHSDVCRQAIKAPLQYEEIGLNPGRKTVDMDVIGDEVLSRKDIGTSYNIACCHDDALQHITHIIRGEDISDLTPLHRVLQELMGWPTPIYHHHALLKNAKGKKLSKRNDDTSIKALREQGFTAAEVLDMATP